MADASAAEACAELVDAGGPADLGTAVRLTLPGGVPHAPGVGDGRRPAAPSRSTPGSTTTSSGSCGGYDLRVTAAREAGHHTHGDGTAVDLVPAVGATQRDWDATAGRLAAELGWTPSCGQLRRPARVRAQAGDPVDRLRRLPEPRLAADLHAAAARRTSTCRGCRAATARARSSQPCAWVMAFPGAADHSESSGRGDEALAS